jgi:hypothetical protein
MENPVSAMLLPMRSLLQPGSGMFSASVGRDRPRGDEKRFLINKRSHS